MSQYLELPSTTLPQDQLADAFRSIVAPHHQNKVAGTEGRKQAHKNGSYSQPSDNQDLITIKNTEDYNNFLRKRDQSGIISEDDRKSMIQFE